MMQTADSLLSELNVWLNAAQIHEMVHEYKPSICRIEKKIKMKIVLKDDIPNYEGARRLALLERFT